MEIALLQMPESRLPINDVAVGHIYGSPSTTSDLTSTSFLSFSYPNLPFLCVAGSYAMSKCG